MNHSKRIKLLIACHKKCQVPSDEVYLPVHVGAEGKEPFGFVTDNTGENISSKNNLYCELTGLYWAWKNLDYEYLGLVHYRRYFTLKNKEYQKKHGELNSVLTYDELKQLLSQYKVIVPKKRLYYIETLYSHYDHTFDGYHLDCTRKIIEKRYPSYCNSFDKVMRSRGGYMFNMFIMSKEMINMYCHWLFDILGEVEEIIDISNLSDFEKRYIGRISEILFNVWLDHQLRIGYIFKKDICEVPYLYMGEIDWKRKVISFLQAKLFHKKYDKSF